MEEVDRRRFTKIKQLLTQLTSFDGNDHEDDSWDEEVPVAAIKEQQLTKVERELADGDRAEEQALGCDASDEGKSGRVAARANGDREEQSKAAAAAIPPPSPPSANKEGSEASKATVVAVVEEE
ncbi:unnamed protein product [Linum trigynum]|uniref:Uncharacterized protein n=1 Tax=Linum trigynum TaxID=586398 RepID=A0AAV2D7L2_9ROSI